MPLDPPDSHHLRAAMGWLELGNQAEAGEEIARLEPGLLNHPDVLDVRWSVCVAGQSWEAALQVAETLITVAPDRSSGWTHRAYALRRIKTGGLPLAWAALRPAFDRFPKDWLIPYNLACYAAQLGQLEESLVWLRRAMQNTRDSEGIKKMALADADLKAVWEQIQKL